MIGYSLLRRYTPPTCTLEIWGKTSVLSFWSDTTLVKDIKFELRLDDPKLPEEEQITLKGDRTQLEMLFELVSSYTENLLISTPKFWGERQQPESVLLTREMFFHELLLDSLTFNDGVRSIILSVSQLFDLANALDDYKIELAILPELEKVKVPKRVNNKTIAVAATILAVGVGTTGVFLINKSNQEVASLDSSTNLSAPSAKTDLSQITSLPKSDTPKNVPIPSPTLPPQLANSPPMAAPAPVYPPQNRSLLSSKGNNTNKEIASKKEKPIETLQQTRVPKSAISNEQKSALENLPPLKDNPIQKPVATQDNQVNNPQISPTQAVKNYFLTRWVAPKELNQALEYRLLIGKDGEVKEIIPLKAVSRVYLNSVALPSKGEKILTSTNGDVTIRVVLNLDNTVATFLESNKL